MNLPLTANCFFIDNTTLEYYTTCRRSFQYFAIERKRLAAERPALAFGQAVHEALDFRYRNEKTLDSVAIERGQLSVLHEFFSKTPMPLDDYRSEAFAIDVVRGYNYEYLQEPFAVLEHNGKLLIEKSFAEPLCTIEGVTFVWTGKVDLVVLFGANNDIYVMDHKTESRDNGFDEFLNSQAMMGYMWAIGKLLGKLPAGFIINKLTCRKPTKTGKGVDYTRQVFPIDPDRIDEWEYNTCQLCADIVADGHRSYFPMETKWCVGKYGPCPYLEVCKLPRQSRSIILNSGIYEENKWSPLKSPDKTDIAKETNNT